MIQPLHGVNPSQNSSRLPSMLGVAKWATIASILCATGAVEAKIVYVNSATATAGNGSTWSTSYKYLQDALANTTAGDAIYIAKGTYYPDKGAGIIDGDREKAFVVKGQKLYGGYVGTEVNLTQRNPQTNVTKLSGAIWEGANSGVYWSLHVLVIKNNSTLDGLTVAEGHADGSETWSFPSDPLYDQGGGCYVTKGVALNLENCTFRDNRALRFGGAIALEDSTSKLIAKGCLFERNTIELYVRTYGIVAGGAIKGNVEATNCNFFSNTAFSVNAVKATISESRGGAIFGDVTATGCQFFGNSAIAYSDAGSDSSGVKPVAAGGAIAGNLTASRCTFTRNQAVTPDRPNSFANASTERTGSGGAFGEGSIIAVNCAFVENQSSNGKIKPEDGTGTGGGGAIYVKSGKSTLTNCVFIKNSSEVRGGAIHSETTSFEDSLTVSNCTLIDNQVASTFRGSALSCSGLVRILNNIFWFNASPSANYSNSNLIHVVYKGALRNSGENYPTPSDIAINLVRGGTNNITEGLAPDIFLGDPALTITSAAPSFTNPADPDGADNIWGTADDGLRLQPSSGAIGIKRDPRVVTSANFLPKDILDVDQDSDVEEIVPTDFAGFARFQNAYLDMGAYEFGTAINSAEISISEVAGRELTDGASFPFGTVKKDKIGKKTFVIKNLGTNRLTKISYTLLGSKQITLRKSYLSRLDPGASVAFTVVYRPTSKGKQTAALRITSSDADESVFNINFSGMSKVAPRKRKARAQMIAAASNGTVEVSSDLLNWSSGAKQTTTLVDGPAVLTFRDNTTLGPGEDR